jgi:TonB family protein
VRSRKRIFIAFTLSAVLHPLAAGGLLLISKLGRHDRPPARTQVSMRTLSARQWAQNRGRSAPPDEVPAPLHPKGQVVDVAPGNDRIPQESKYLAETNNRVDKQTRAREQSQKWSVAAAKNTDKPEAMPVVKGRQAASQTPSAVSAASRLDGFQGLLGARPRLSQMMQQAMPGPTVPSPSTSAGDESRGVESTVPSTGGAAPNDNLQDVEAGDGTFLNTREWRYAAFFNRVKQAVSAHWDPNSQLKRKPTAIERTTMVQVALRPDGSLADVFVAKTSGNELLDREAMAAFERAAPFPNPPQQLVENGFIRFAFSFSIVNEGLSVPRMLGFGLPRAR